MIEIPTLTTPRLVLRPFDESDVAAYGPIRVRPEVVRWLRPLQPDETPEAMARRLIGHFHDCWRERGVGPWAVVESASGRLIGHCGLRFVPDFDRVEVFYTLSPEVWRRGYASEAAAASLAWGFDTAGLAEIFAVTLPHNAASRGVMEKIGLRYRRMAKFHGLDVVYYDIDAQSWRDRRRV